LPNDTFPYETADNPDGVDNTRFEQWHGVDEGFPKWLTDNLPPFFTLETSPEMKQWAFQICLQTSLKALVDCSHAFVETDFRAEMRRLLYRLLSFMADADRSAAIDLTGRKSAKLISGVSIQSHEGAPHGLPITPHGTPNRDLLIHNRLKKTKR